MISVGGGEVAVVSVGGAVVSVGGVVVSVGGVETHEMSCSSFSKLSSSSTR